MKIKKKEAQAPAYGEVEIREPLVEDMLAAERIAGTDQGMRYAMAVLSQIAVFDGKRLPAEELQKISVKDFFGLARELGDLGLGEQARELLPSQEKENSG